MSASGQDPVAAVTLLRRAEAPPEQLSAWLRNVRLPEWREFELEQERLVTDYISSMPLLCLAVPTNNGGSSDRAYLERNCIGLLATTRNRGGEPSKQWLGRYAVSAAIPRSGLWNVNHVDANFEPGFLELFEAYVQASARQ